MQVTWRPVGEAQGVYVSTTCGFFVFRFFQHDCQVISCERCVGCWSWWRGPAMQSLPTRTRERATSLTRVDFMLIFFFCLFFLARPILLRLRSGPRHMPQCGEPTGRSGCVSACANQQQIATLCSLCVSLPLCTINSLLSPLVETTDIPIYFNSSICDCMPSDTATDHTSKTFAADKTGRETKKLKRQGAPRDVLPIPNPSLAQSRPHGQAQAGPHLQGPEWPAARAAKRPTHPSVGHPSTPRGRVFCRHLQCAGGWEA